MGKPVRDWQRAERTAALPWEDSGQPRWTYDCLPKERVHALKRLRAPPSRQAWGFQPGFSSVLKTSKTWSQPRPSVRKTLEMGLVIFLSSLNDSNIKPELKKTMGMVRNSDFEWCYTAYKLLLCTSSHLILSTIGYGQTGSCFTGGETETGSLDDVPRVLQLKGL